ncbi:ataxin-3-like protein [Panicum hallii]|uniref:ataxin-3-like protein n=1 Tax=Panicum hallii TaxID=206008 RepID=UPI000DF4D082|nr:ataxin-3-like protein [Panicum hallii]
MDAAASNGGLLYHGVQEGKLCVVHCINTALQGPYFFEFDLAALACDLDQRECLVMLESSQSPARPTLPVGTSTMSPSEAISAFRSVQEFQSLERQHVMNRKVERAYRKLKVMKEDHQLCKYEDSIHL